MIEDDLTTGSGSQGLTMADLAAQKSSAAETVENQQAQDVAKKENAPVVNVPAVIKSPAELAAEAKAAEEARLAAQTPYDPKLHGVGTHPASGPQSVMELYKMLVAKGVL